MLYNCNKQNEIKCHFIGDLLASRSDLFVVVHFKFDTHDQCLSASDDTYAYPNVLATIWFPDT